MNTLRKAQLTVLVCLASAALWSQAGSTSNSSTSSNPSTSNAQAGGSNSRGYILNRVRVSAGVEERNLIHKVVLPYPEYAKTNRIQGTVQLHAIIDKQGNVASLKAIAGHPSLIPTALEAVKQWRYKPYMLNGEAVEVETMIVVNFNLAPMERSDLPAQRSRLPIPASLQTPMSL